MAANIKSTSHRGEKIKSYSIEFKLTAIDYANLNSNRAASRKYGVDEKRIREWKKKHAELSNARVKKGGLFKKRLEGGGRKITDEDIEEHVLNWIHARRDNRLRVSRKLIMRKAKTLYDESVGDDECEKSAFVASRGWLEKFMKRNCLSLRQRTTMAQKDPSQLINKLVAYVLEVRRLTEQYKYAPESIIAMNETAVWADMVSSTTVDVTGKKEICLKTTGHEKVRISVCLSAKADGTKLKPFIVFGGAKREVEALNKEFRTRCVVASSSNAWMNEDLTVRYVETVLGKFSFARRLLAWDSFECHTMDSIKKIFKDSKVNPVVIPGGCTKYLQAPDVSWNKPFKAVLMELYDAWLSDGIHQYTAAGNLKAPPREKIVEWVLESWSKLSRDVIVKSFKVCGLNLPTDGSEDHLIYCFKEGTPCAEGAAILQQQLMVRNDGSFNTNPFITESDEEDALEEFHLLDPSDDEDDIIDI